MAKVLIFNNFLKEGEKSTLESQDSALHEYTSFRPCRWQANPYSKKKHIEAKDLIKRIVACIILWIRWHKYDVLIVDSAITGFFVSALSFLHKGRRKLVIASFNVPRRRTGFWKWLGKILYRRVDHFFVHSRYDIQLARKFYCLAKQRFTFQPYTRSAPATGEPQESYLFEDGRPFILSFGGNARDYRTFFQAVEVTDLYAVVVAREYNLEGLTTPKNVRAFFNIPLEECDKLVSKCLFTVFTFDGSEPSCGQISIVTSFMLGKPTICTDWMGVHDYVTDGDNGLLVKMKDPDDLRSKIMQLVNDKKLYDRLSEGAQLWAERNANPRALQQKVDSLVTKLTSDQVPVEP